jgi:hypothetical protein
MKKIEFVRSGGFMGRKVSLSLDLEDMPPEQVETLRLLLDKADFFNLDDSPGKPPMPDAYQYTITVTTETGKRMIHTSDTTVSEKLRPLITDLTARARAG